MVALAISTAIILVSTLYDAHLTRKRVEEWGPGAELNREFRYVLDKIGDVTAATLVVVVLPSVILMSAGWLLGASHFMAGLAGARLAFTFVQVQSMDLEKKVRATATRSPSSAS